MNNLVITLNTWLLNDNWEMIETPEEIQKNLGVSADFAKRLEMAVIHFIHVGGDFTGEDVVNYAFGLVLNGFRDESDAREYLNNPNPNGFAFYDVFGYSISQSLLEEVIKMKWG